MKALIIFDSYFGTTEQIAHAIAGSFSKQDEVSVIKVDSVQEEQLEGKDLLVVGSPTRGFRPSEATTNFINSLAKESLSGKKVAAFDTRILLEDLKSGIARTLVNIGGYAAKPIAKRLQKAGGELVLPPEGFYVRGEKGVLKDGELERAEQWGKLLSK